MTRGKWYPYRRTKGFNHRTAMRRKPARIRRARQNRGLRQASYPFSLKRSLGKMRRGFSLKEYYQLGRSGIYALEHHRMRQGD